MSTFSNRADVLPIPQVFVAAICDGNIESIKIMARTYVATAIFQCDKSDTGQPWDVGFCLGYCIYANTEDYVFLKSCENAFSKLGKILASGFYDIEDRRPYGAVVVKQHTELTDLSIPEQVRYLTKCYQIHMST